MLFGVWVILFLFLGFPSAWDKILAVATGLIIVSIAYRMAPQIEHCSENCQCESKRDMPFVQHKAEEDKARSGALAAGPINNSQIK